MYAKPRFWKPTSTFARWVTGVLVIQAVLNVACMFVNEALRWERLHDVLQTTDTSSSDFNRRLTDAVNNTPGGIWLTLAGWATTISLVLLIVWSHRSATNALALRRTGARQSPGWVIAGWLVPFVNFVLPYQTMSDLWRGSDPAVGRGDGWRSRRPAGRVIAWWAAYLVGTGLTAVLILATLTGDVNAADGRPWFAATHGILAVASLLGAWIVWDVTLRQARQQDADPAPTAEQASARGAYPAQTITRGPDGLPVPGWYPDPNGAYDHRYWDGRAWTEHVSTAGVATLAPVVAAPALATAAPVSTSPTIAPDWYPDPAGRHQWRFWGGDDWTPHVSDDDAHSDDALDGPAPAPAPHTD